MANQTSNGNILTDTLAQITQQIEKTTDINKLFKDNKFIDQLKNLDLTQQFQIFQQYQDKFSEISKNSGSAITTWTQNMTSQLANLNVDSKDIQDALQQGQSIFDSITNSLN